jgi:NAD(P)-dependent dehydrogenase (short-subunit alcohol dehydrogenase family)
METRVALITGASSGIGRACATHVAALGVRVYGTSRAAPTGVRLQLNVTDDTQFSAQSIISSSTRASWTLW